MKSIIPILFFVALVYQFFSCSTPTQQAETAGPPAEGQLSLQQSSFGRMDDGTAVSLYTLTNASGMEVRITNYGGTVVALLAPDRQGRLEDVVLGFDSLQGYRSPLYLQEGPYFGALIGRYGNRIALGRFALDGQPYQLATNNEPNHLHGGTRGFDKVVWQAEPLQEPDAVGVQLRHISPDGEEGYPGTLTVEVTYRLTNDNALSIHYSATTDQKTVLNLTNHTYFNLSGSARRDILAHELMLEADRFLPVSESLIPLGELRPVAGTSFDFTQPTPIGQRIDQSNEQLAVGRGYDHCWVLRGTAGEMRRAATLHDPASGRFMEVFTTEPAIQFYSGNFLKGNLTGKGEVAYGQRWGLCLETQHYPDSPNQPAFPSTELKPGEVYETQTTYRFSVK
ncbi:aldose epimerase family protein [Cesiribacter andamanensis]|uniref:Aldose 1-epimerase n=1 Tax=Cesiribacter andamanensis AMV16 TaxID=1279009 RepID=M7NH26_9BACT|nr:aldose epimerase family protein [Cesiribacter andamanensis]EMR01130.1 Aldose 1-epimerase precursor [Cesiribacter andamanensis AMV16]